MPLSNLIQIAGGVDNIQRVLVGNDNSVALSLIERVDPTYLPAHLIHEKIQQEWQLKSPQECTLDKELLSKVGEAIATRYKSKLKTIAADKYSMRPAWHISPPKGLLNDPNGFIFHQGQFHLFYQWSPFECAHKDKFWAHLTSTDLIHWRWQEPSLIPSDWYDSHGAFSGHAISQGDELVLFYTGNSRIGPDRQRITTQCLAKSTNGMNFTKLGPVIDKIPSGITEHIRDPKVYYRNNQWHMLLGAQTDDLKGRLALYLSQDLQNWQYKGLLGKELGDYGYMWECPDFFELSGQAFVAFGPQGISAESEYDTNPHQNRLFTVNENEDGTFDFDQEWTLDYGFDFYAPQTVLTSDGRRVMIGWMGLPDDISHPTVDNGWIHQLTAPRTLTYIDGNIVQMPVNELDRLKSQPKSLQLDHRGIDIDTKSYELTLSLESTCSLMLMDDGLHRVKLKFNSEKQTFRFDRSQTFIANQDVVREVVGVGEQITLTILADNSSLEVFINNGEKVMSGRVFTPQNATKISLLGAKAEAIIRTIEPATPPFPCE